MLKYVERRHTDSMKWDDLTGMFGGEDLLAMWVADMDIQVPPCVQEALHAYVDRGIFGYPIVPDSYKEAFIDWERTHFGWQVEADWIRFSPGVVSGFNWAISALTKPGDAMIVLTPVYYPFLDAADNSRLRLVTSDLVNTDGYYTIDFEDFERKITDEQVRVFLHSSPHNPVGRVWTREEQVRLFDICKKHDVVIISDEIHQDFVHGDRVQVPSLSLSGYDDRLIVMTAPSKTFNLASCQNSFIIIKDEKLRASWDAYVKAARIKWGNAFGYIAAEAAYRGGEDWYREVKALIYDNYRYVKETFEKECPAIRVTPLEGTYLLWIDMRETMPVEELHDFITKTCRIAFDFGEWFGGDRFRGFVRMNLATSRENVAEALKRILEGLKER